MMKNNKFITYFCIKAVFFLKISYLCANLK